MKRLWRQSHTLLCGRGMLVLASCSLPAAAIVFSLDFLSVFCISVVNFCLDLESANIVRIS